MYGTYNVPYALFNSSIIFNPFQYIPYFKFFYPDPKIKRNSEYMNLYIADEVGVGKTVEAGIIISELLHRNPKAKIMILTPPSLCKQWQSELNEKFCNIIAYDHYTKPGDRRLDIENSVCIYAYTYQSLERIKNQLDRLSNPFRIDLLIIDEVHNFRNEKTLNPLDHKTTINRGYKDLQDIIVYFTDADMKSGDNKKFSRILMSATPIFNRKKDYENELIFFHDISKNPDGSITIKDKELDLCDRTNSKKSISNCLDFQPLIKSVVVEYDKEEKCPERWLYNRISEIENINNMTKSAVYLHEACSSIPCLIKTIKDGPKKIAENNIKEWKLKNGNDEELSNADISRIAESIAGNSIVDKYRDINNTSGLKDAIQYGYDIIVKVLVEKPYEIEINQTIINNIIDILYEIIVTKVYMIEKVQEYKKRKTDDKDAKLDKLDEIWERLDKNKNDEYKCEYKHAVIFSRYITSCNYIKEFFEKKGFLIDKNLFIATGENTKEENDAIIINFNNSCREDKENSVLICSDVCREGKNMQECQVLINFDLPFSPSIMQQRIGRIDRTGQTRTPLVYNLICDFENDWHTYLDIINEKIGVINSIKDICNIDVTQETNKKVQNHILEELVKKERTKPDPQISEEEACKKIYRNLYDGSEPDPNDDLDTIKANINKKLFGTTNKMLKEHREEEHNLTKVDIYRKIFGEEGIKKVNINGKEVEEVSMRRKMIEFVNNKLKELLQDHFDQYFEYSQENDTYELSITEELEEKYKNLLKDTYFKAFRNFIDSDEPDVCYTEGTIAYTTAIYQEVKPNSDTNGINKGQFEETTGEKYDKCIVPLNDLCELLKELEN